MTKKASSSMASGAPPKMTRANATPRSTDQRQRPSRTMCTTASNMKGMETNPSVMSTWLIWLSTTPENENATAASTHGTVDSFSARRKRYMPTATSEKRITSVAIHATRSGRIAKSPIEGVERPGIEAGEKRRAAEEVGIPKRQFAAAIHGPDQHMERVVLLQVVTRHQEVTAEEIREDERRGRKADQHGVGPQRADMTCALSSRTDDLHPYAILI